MKIKILLLLTVYTFISSCSSDNKFTNLFKTEISKDSSSALPPFYGYWLSDNYLQDLEHTKSTKAAQALGQDHIIRIYGDSLIMKLSLHEGGAQNKLLFSSPTEATVVSPSTGEVYNHLKLIDNKLIVDEESYTKINEVESRPQLYELINRKIISGKYKMNSNTVELMDNGDVKGLDSITAYKLNLDYTDAGMQYDKIYLKTKNKKDLHTFIYELKDKTLSIVDINCVKKDKKDDWCLVIEKGKVIYQMEKE